MKQKKMFLLENLEKETESFWKALSELTQSVSLCNPISMYRCQGYTMTGGHSCFTCTRPSTAEKQHLMFNIRFSFETITQHVLDLILTNMFVVTDDNIIL